MTGFLPLSIAGTGTTPQTAPDAVTAPATGADSAFAAVLAGMTGTGSSPAPMDARAAKEVSTAQASPTPGGSALGSFSPAPIQPVGSALQRLKLAFAGSANIPAGLGLTTGTANSASSALFLAPTATPAAAPGGSARDTTTPGHTAHAQTQPPATVDVAEPAAPDASGMPPVDGASPARPEAVARTGRTGADADIEPERTAAGTASDADTSDQPVALSMAAGQQTVPQPASPQPSAVTIDWSAASAGASAPVDGAPAEAAAQAPAAGGATQPEPAATEDTAQPAVQVAANPAASAKTADNTADAARAPAPADVAALAAIAPAAGRSEQNAPIQATAPHGDPTSQATGGLTKEAPAVADRALPTSPTEPDVPTAGKPSVADRLADLGTNAGLADKTVAETVSGTGQHDTPRGTERPGQEDTRATDGNTAQPNADDGRSAQVARPTVAMTEQTTQQSAQQPVPATPQTATPDGLQPLSAQSAAPHGSSPHGTQPHPADVVKVATPQQLPEAVGMAISRHVGNESTEFTLRLDPAELGRVEVKLELGKDGQAVVSVQADNASTMDLLRRDAHALERALLDAGLKLDSGGLNFSLRQQDGQSQQQFAGEGNGRASHGRMQEASLAGLEPDTTPRPSRRSAAGLLDLSI